LERLSLAYIATALVGIGLAVYTANEYLTHNFTSCNINKQLSCGGVFQSGQTSLFGIPFYVMGLVWFPLALGLGLATSRMGKTSVNGDILLPLLMVGNVFTGYLWYLELVVIGIICPLCVSLYIINYTLTAITLASIFKTSPLEATSGLENQ
jgi:uncharacterized membrane protein